MRDMGSTFWISVLKRQIYDNNGLVFEKNMLWVLKPTPTRSKHAWKNMFVHKVTFYKLKTTHICRAFLKASWQSERWDRLFGFSVQEKRQIYNKNGLFFERIYFVFLKSQNNLKSINGRLQKNHSQKAHRATFSWLKRTHIFRVFLHDSNQRHGPNFWCSVLKKTILRQERYTFQKEYTFCF